MFGGTKASCTVPDLKSPKSPPWLKRLGSRIRQARRIRGLTQTDVARPNLTKSFISLLESGRTYPSVGTLVALANRLQTSMALLLLDTPQLPREAALNLLTLARLMAESAPGQADRLLGGVEVLSADSDELRAELMLARGDIASIQAKLKEALRWFEETLTWARKRRLRGYEPRALARLAYLDLRHGDDAAARQRLEEALAQFRATKTLRSVEGCDAMLAHGEILSRQGKTGRALRVLEEVAQVAQRQDLPLTLARAYVASARTHIESGRSQQAAGPLRSAKDALEGADDSPELSATLRALGRLLSETGSLQDAQAVLQHALQVQERLRETRSRAATLDEMARVLLRLGRIGEAQTNAKSALEMAKEQHEVPQQGRALVTLAQIAKAQRRWKQATDQLREAVDLFKKAHMTADLGETARELGMLLKERGEHAQAADYLAMAISTERPVRGTGD